MSEEDLRKAENQAGNAQANLERERKNWYELMAVIARLDPQWKEGTDGEEPDPSDPDFRECYDPWEGLREIAVEVRRFQDRADFAEAALKRAVEATEQTQTPLADEEELHDWIVHNEAAFRKLNARAQELEAEVARLKNAPSAEKPLPEAPMCTCLDRTVWDKAKNAFYCIGCDKTVEPPDYATKAELRKFAGLMLRWVEAESDGSLLRNDKRQACVALLRLLDGRTWDERPEVSFADQG